MSLTSMKNSSVVDVTPESMTDIPTPTPTPAPSSTSTLFTHPRPDDRQQSELRPLTVTHGLLHRADGSVEWSQGDTKVLVGVYGPIVTGSVKDEKPDRATVQVNFKAANGAANNIDIERGSYIRQSFEPVLLLTAHPRTKIQITIQVIRDGGSVLAAALNATTLALVDAGVSSIALLTAVSIAAKEKDKQQGRASSSKSAATTTAGNSETHDFLLDPVTEEEEACAATSTFAFGSNSPGTILSVMERGQLDQQNYTDATQLARAASAHILQFMKSSLEKRTTATLTG